MSNTVPFPRNYEAFLEKGMVAVQQGDFAEAIDFFKKALLIQVDEEVLLLCLTLLKETGNKVESLELIRQYCPYVYESSDVNPFDIEFISLLIETEQFDEAENQMKQRTLLLENKEEYHHLYHMLDKKMSAAQDERDQQQAIKTAQIIRESKDISIKNHIEQLQFIKKLETLSKKDLETVAAYLLHQDIHPLLLTEVISLLITAQINSTMLVKKENFAKEVNIGGLSPVEQSSFFQEGISFISQSEQPQSEKDKLKEIFFLHCAYYFPFEREALFSAEIWLKTIQNQYVAEEHREIQTYIERAEAGLDLFTEL